MQDFIPFLTIKQDTIPIEVRPYSEDVIPVFKKTLFLASDGSCDLNQNTEDNFFDFGDCCLEDISCRVKFFNSSNYVEKYCPTNPCIRSNIFCVEEELGNGICEDYNNGPYCDYDLGDCCLSPPNHSWTTPGEISKRDCCICSCKQNALYNANSYMFN